MLKRCCECNLVYSDPQPVDEGRQAVMGEPGLAAHFECLAERKRVLFERRLARLPQRGGRWSRLCDVGCGDGQFLELARSAGWDVVGIEPNASAAARARARGIPVVETTLEDARAAESHGPFDVVTAWDVLEHTPAPRAFAERLVELVAPTGLLVVGTLNRRSLVARVFRMKWSMVGAGHFTYWDQRSLATLFRVFGFDAVAWEVSGLGRDFVRWLGGPEQHTTPSGTASSVARTSAMRAWDAHPAVVRIEAVVNRLLDITKLGVELTVTLRRSRLAAAPV